MGVYIKDMEMPKNCRECNFCNEINFEGYLWFDFYCRARDKSFDLDKNEDKPNWCPLVEVPTPHGRLGDLDELWDRMSKYTDNEGAKMPFGYEDSIIHRDSACELVEDAHTVIEAEG